MTFARTGIVHTDWSFDLAVACQEFVGGVLEPEPDELRRAVKNLVKALPELQRQAERAMLLDRLKIATDNAGHQFHVLFHRFISHRCNGQRQVMRQPLRWNDCDSSPDQLLVAWVAEYLDEFEKSHEWPAPIRAARILRVSLDKPFEVDRVARVVGSARSALMRSFKATYGISMGHYDARCRMRAAFGLLREPGSNVGAVAYRVGYQCNKNFYRTLRRLTGLAPAGVREMADDDADQILRTHLSLPSPTVQQARMRSNARTRARLTMPNAADSILSARRDARRAKRQRLSVSRSIADVA